MHKAFAYILPVPNAIGNGHLPDPWNVVGGRGEWRVEGWGQWSKTVGWSDVCFVFTSLLIGAFDLLLN